MYRHMEKHNYESAAEAIQAVRDKYVCVCVCAVGVVHVGVCGGGGWWWCVRWWWHVLLVCVVGVCVLVVCGHACGVARLAV